MIFLNIAEPLYRPKPLIIIAGGFDVASVHHIRYGAMRRGSRKAIGNWILSRATKIISVSKSNYKEILNNTTVSKSKVKLIRDGIVVLTSTLSSLKRFQDDVKEVSKGYDCGIQLKNYNDIKVGDVLEFFNELEVKKKIKS